MTYTMYVDHCFRKIFQLFCYSPFLSHHYRCPVGKRTRKENFEPMKKCCGGWACVWWRGGWDDVVGRGGAIGSGAAGEDDDCFSTASFLWIALEDVTAGLLPNIFKSDVCTLQFWLTSRFIISFGVELQAEFGGWRTQFTNSYLRFFVIPFMLITYRISANVASSRVVLSTTIFCSSHATIYTAW